MSSRDLCRGASPRDTSASTLAVALSESPTTSPADCDVLPRFEDLTVCDLRLESLPVGLEAASSAGLGMADSTTMTDTRRLHQSELYS